MEYIMTKDSKKLKAYMLIVIGRTGVTEEEIIKRLGSKTPSWKNRMEAVAILLGGVPTCALCGAPTLPRKTHRRHRACSLYPVHSYVRSEKDLGKNCEHGVYLAECETCLKVVMAEASRYSMSDWWNGRDYATVTFS